MKLLSLDGEPLTEREVAGFVNDALEDHYLPDMPDADLTCDGNVVVLRHRGKPAFKITITRWE
jgi:hypothetical protein